MLSFLRQNFLQQLLRSLGKLLKVLSKEKKGGAFLVSVERY